MKKTNYFSKWMTLAFCFGLILFTFSCNKEKSSVALTELADANMAKNLTHIIDGEVVSDKEFVWGVEDYIYHINIGEKNNPDSETVYYMAFSKEEDYANFMREEIGERYDREEAAIDHLRKYAEESGAIEYLEKHGEISKEYTEYETAYLKKTLPEQFETAKQRGSTCVIFRNLFCQRAFNLTIPLLGTPFFIFNNNRASSFTGLLIGGHQRAFDRSFYRRTLFGVNVWGFNCLNLPAFLEDRASSWWSFGV